MSLADLPPSRRAALRGPAVTFDADPFLAEGAGLVFEPDALIIIEDGRIVRFGPHAALASSLPADVAVTHYPDCLISAGFIDAHVHYPQLPMLGAGGEGLLEWLERYVFAAERRFADPLHAARVARTFLRGLIAAGTTTAAVYCTVHPQSVDAFFAESERFGTRMIAGKVLMDRNAPGDLLDTPRRGHDESLTLIRRWHANGRQLYAVTPRFAPTSSPAQLEAAASLLGAADHLYMQTHIAETEAELDWVRRLFPDQRDYLDVYGQAGLLGPRAILGHGIHLSEAELCECHRTGSALAHCPTSNLFLGSGLFRLDDALDPRRPVRVALGSDVGAGTSLSSLVTLNEAHKVARLRGRRLSAAQGFYLATAGGAAALGLEGRVGRLAPGLEADLCVLDPSATELLAFRRGFCDSIEEVLFMLMTMGCEQAVRATWVDGCLVYDRDRRPDPFDVPDRSCRREMRE